ncbi:MAG: hypothetical protein M1546_12645 [Chloroflexi bacterium]|nr:hypothetical protein [Chloroflexota bacterium]
MKMTVRKIGVCLTTLFIGLILFALVGIAIAHAGPVIIDGTDANDHGHETGGANFEGWKYMQRALESLAAQLTSTNVATVVVDLGTTPVDVCTDLTDPTYNYQDARQAITSAFNLSSLPAQGWTLIHVDGPAAIDAWLSNISTTTTGILYIPTYALYCGDLTNDEMATINTHAADIAEFVGGAGDPTKGGGLFAMGEQRTALHPDGFLWLETLIPGIIVTSADGHGVDTPIYLTAQGMAEFPDLTNADLSGGPWHVSFNGNMGSLKVLGVATETVGVTRNIILGGGISTTIGPGTGNSDLFVIKTVTPTIGAVGLPLTYTIVVTNGGPDAATNVVLTDALAISVTLSSVTTTQGTCTGTATVVCNLGTISTTGGATVTVIVTPIAPADLVNTVVVKGDEVDPNPQCIDCTVTVTVGTASFDLLGSAAITPCVYPGTSFSVTWVITNVGNDVFPGGLLNTAVTGSGSGPGSVTVGAIPTNTSAVVSHSVTVSQPIPYGAETVTVTGNISDATAVLAAHICAPDFRTSTITTASQYVFAHQEFTYTWHIRNTGDADAISTTAMVTLSQHALFQFQDVFTWTAGTVSVTMGPTPTHILWTGDILAGQEVTIVYRAHSMFGLPSLELIEPFEVTHPWRPTFYGMSEYLYPYKLFFMIVLRDATPALVQERR